MYIGETGRTLEKRLNKHKAAVKKDDTKNGIAVRAWANQHQVNWEAASVKQEERSYWRRRVLEALHIHQQHRTSNLDCGLNINTTWLPLLDKTSLPLPSAPMTPNQNIPLLCTPSDFILCNYSIHPTISRCPITSPSLHNFPPIL